MTFLEVVIFDHQKLLSRFVKLLLLLTCVA